jgi:hypothetical protein
MFRFRGHHVRPERAHFLLSQCTELTRSAEFRPSGFLTGASDTMATQIVMDHTGDTRHQFDPTDLGAVAEAERRFKELTGSGFIAAKRLDDGKSEVVKSFDATAEEMLFIPRLQGG